MMRMMNDNDSIRYALNAIQFQFHYNSLLDTIHWADAEDQMSASTNQAQNNICIQIN